jgi:uncharacterized repeat protein (TIGR03803 family)
LRNLLLTVLGFVAAGEVNAQTLKTVYTFSGNDGDRPMAGLILAGSILYGTTSFGSGGYGNVFSVTTNGTNFTNLYSFSMFTGQLGENPQSRLTLGDNLLYGTTPTTTIQFTAGALFNLRSDGANFGNLYVFSGNDGAHPSGPLGVTVDLLAGTTTLYGATAAGGNFGNGTVFSLSTYGSLTTLYHFGGGDGAAPSGVILSGNTLYGTTKSGGSFGRGTIYAINSDGTGFTTLYNFGTATNTDGGYPNPGLTLSGNTLYGTAYIGGSANQGTVFKVNVDGTAFGVLHAFTALLAATNSDGANPNGELSVFNGTLYGSTSLGGAWGKGTLFKVSTDGTTFTTLYNFTGGPDGAGPNGGLVIASNELYGTTKNGGGGNYGTVFSLSDSPPVPIPPRLTISYLGPNVILAWPTSRNGFSYVGYTLESTANVSSPVWGTSLTTPVILNGHYTVTNPISGTHQFFRLSQ